MTVQNLINLISELKAQLARLEDELKKRLKTVEIAPWYSYAKNFLGLKEDTRSHVDNPIIARWGKYIEGYHTWDDDNAWCAVAMNGILHESGFQGTGSALARSFLDLEGAEEIQEPKKGAIVIFWRGRGPSDWRGHVGIVESWTDTTINCMGGNQKNAFNVSAYSRDRVLGYRWPRKKT